MRRLHRLRECIFLFAVVCFSALPYQFGLGFYADDWNTISVLGRTTGAGPVLMLKELLASDPDMKVRPVQAVSLVIGFEAFGSHAILFHLVNTVIVGLMVVIFYITLEDFLCEQGPRLQWTAFSVALVFGLLPHYSTDKLWVSSQQASLSMAFALLGIFAARRWTKTDSRMHVGWLSVAIASLILSTLAYEVAGGLIVTGLAWIGWTRYRESSSSVKPGKWMGRMIPLLAVLLAVGVVKARMQTRVIYHHHLMHVLGNLGQMIRHAIMQALQFNLWAYGLRMPVLLGRLYQLGALSATALWVAAMIAIFVAAYLWRYMEPDQMPHMREWLRLAGVGFFLFFLGFVFFFNNTDYDFSSAGIANRVAIASALGTGCIAVAVVGLVTGILPRRELRNAAFSVAIGIVCGANCLAMSGIAWHWHQAAMRQREVLDSMRQDLSPLPHSSVLLQDGYCRYVGPAVVFDGDWDSTGALRVLTGDHSLLSDVVSPDLRFERYAVITPLPEEDERNYPYSNHLFVYNVKYRVLRALPDKSAADAYLRAFNPSGDGGCPFGKEGYGTKAF